MLTKDGQWKPAVDPIHYDKAIAGAGLAKPFAHTLIEKHSTISIGLIPAACGGSAIFSWEPGAYFEATKSHPYDDAIARTKRAMEKGALKGILWHQGEADSNPEKAGHYKEKLKRLIERFRKDLNAENLPFIIGQLGQFSGDPWDESKKEVNKAHISLANEMDRVSFNTISFIHNRQKSSAVVTKVDDYNVAIRYGDFYAKKIIEDLGLIEKDGVIRVSMVHYNSIDEVNALINAFEIIFG